MSYTYEGTIEQVEGDWLVSFPAFDGCFAGGKTMGEACANASAALQLVIAAYLNDGSCSQHPNSVTHHNACSP